jgi:hypothetical protein
VYVPMGMLATDLSWYTLGQDPELVYKAGTATGDYHGQMNSSKFQKWVRDILL